MSCINPIQETDRCFEFTNARQQTFRLHIVDDPCGTGAFTIHVVPVPSSEAPLDISPSERRGEPLDSSHHLTERERDVALLVGKGLTNDQISAELCISLSTVKTHLRNIYAKKGVANRTSLASLMYADQSA